MGDLDEVVKKALKEQRELRARLKEVDAFLENTRRYNDGKLPIVDNANEMAARSHERMREYVQRRRRSTEGVVQAATEILREVGRPMTRFELADALERRNVVVGGTDKAKNIGTILWRSPDFVSTGEGYWVAEEID